MIGPLALRLEFAGVIAPLFRDGRGRTARRVKIVNAEGRITRIVTTDELRTLLLRRAKIEFGMEHADFRECLTCRFPFVPERDAKKYCSDACRARARIAILTPEQRENLRRKNSEWYAKRTPEQRAKKAARERERYAKLQKTISSKRRFFVAPVHA